MVVFYEFFLNKTYVVCLFCEPLPTVLGRADLGPWASSAQLAIQPQAGFGGPRGEHLQGQSLVTVSASRHAGHRLWRELTRSR
jgi:hypothetical protein